ncbi:MAG TPA: YdcF family protein [Euzebya sp.]|nr:YdcF family protein [Euzebya sp.]
MTAPARTRRRRGLPHARRVMTWALVVIMLYLSATFAEVWWTSSRDRARPAEAIIVLGAAQYEGRPSPVFEARLDHAADLYVRGMAPVVVVTGGRQPGDRVSEASAASAYMHARGVPEAALRREVHASTSYESLAAIARFLREERIDEVILVSDGWHLGRSAAIARSVGLQPLSSPAPGSPYSPASSLQQMVRETLGLSLGRLIGFRRLDNLSAAAA